VAGNQVLIAQFSQHVAAAFSQKDANLQDVRAFAKAVRSDYDSASAIVNSTKTGDLLAGLMTAYLALYAKFASNSSAIHYYRSDGLFDMIFEQSGSLPDVIVFTIWDSLLTGETEPANFRGLKQRYADLAQFWRKRLDKFRFEQNRNKGSILDLLRAEYQRQHNGKAPASDDDLYDFDPKPGLDLSSANSAIATMKSFWILVKPNQLEATMVRVFNGALESFNDFARATGKRDLLGLFQILKQLRTAFVLRYEKRTNPKSGESKWFGLPPAEDDNTRVLLYGLYAIACIALWAEARTRKLFEKNRLGFTAAEIAFFMKPIEQNQFRYRSNIRRALSGDMANIRTPFEEVRAFLNTYSWTKNNLRELDLVELDETLRIQKIWKGVVEILSDIGMAARHNDKASLQEIVRNPQHAQALSDLNDITSTVYKTQNSQFLGKETLAAGSMVGSSTKYGDLTIVYISPKDRRIYVEYAGLRPQLLIAQPGYIDNAFYRGMILEIYNATVGAVYITRLIFTAMGFLPVLIEAGFAGLIYEILVAYASEEVGKQAAKVNETFGEFVSLALQIVAPRPHFKPQVKEAATRVESVRSAVLNPANAETLTENRGLADARASDAERGIAEVKSEPPPTIETRSKQPAANDTVPAPRPEAPRPPGSHPAMAAELDAAVAEVAELKRAEEIATQMTDRLAEQREAQASASKAVAGGRAKVGKVTSRQATAGSRGAGGGSGRGTGDRSVPRKIELIPAVKLRIGKLAGFVEKVADVYRNYMNKLKHIDNLTVRSQIAHEKTRRQMIAEFENVVGGKQITGVTDVHVRESDVAYHDPSARVNRNVSGPVIELKAWAYTQDGIMKTAGGGFDAGASSAQIQAYEVLADELGAPVFIIDGSGRIYARDSANAKWFRADKH